MPSHRRFVASLVLVCLAAGGGGCTSMKTIRPATALDAAPFGTLKVGDMVSVKTRDGASARFVVQEIAGDTLIAPAGGRYSRGEIVELKRRSFSTPKTAGLVGGVFAGMMLMWAAAAAAALGSLMG